MFTIHCLFYDYPPLSSENGLRIITSDVLLINHYFVSGHSRTSSLVRGYSPNIHSLSVAHILWYASALRLCLSPKPVYSSHDLSDICSVCSFQGTCKNHYDVSERSQASLARSWIFFEYPFSGFHVRPHAHKCASAASVSQALILSS